MDGILQGAGLHQALNSARSCTSQSYQLLHVRVPVAPWLQAAPRRTLREEGSHDRLRQPAQFSSDVLPTA